MEYNKRTRYLLRAQLIQVYSPAIQSLHIWAANLMTKAVFISTGKTRCL